MLSKKNISQRKKYFEKYRNKTYDYFENFIFTDESMFRILNAKGGSTYYKNAKSGSENRVCVRTKKFGGGGVMIWGFITSKGDFKIFKCPKKVNSGAYIKILEDFALPEIVKCGFKLSDVIFMQDNASCHTSQVTKKWFQNNNITLMDWPPQSPDMNPIENLWDLLDSRARVRQNEIIDDATLWNILLEESKKIDKSYVIKLYQSIPRRINALKDSKFDITKY